MSNGIPPPPINRQPIGYLGLLDIKSGGRFPAVAWDSLTPVIDLAAFYAQAQAEFINFNDTGVGPAGGSFRSGFTVPQNEAWYVWHYAVKWVFNAAAGELFEGVPAISTPATPGISVPLGTSGSTFATTSSAGAARVGSCAIHYPFIANPGDRIGILTSQIVTAGTITLVYSGRIQRMRV